MPCLNRKMTAREKSSRLCSSSVSLTKNLCKFLDKEAAPILHVCALSRPTLKDRATDVRARCSFPSPLSGNPQKKLPDATLARQRLDLPCSCNIRKASTLKFLPRPGYRQFLPEKPRLLRIPEGLHSILTVRFACSVPAFAQPLSSARWQ